MGLASGRRYSRSLTGSFLSSYTPSLTSTTFGLFGKPSKTALTTGVVTPFERRYIVRRKKVRPVRQASNTILRKRRKRRWNWY
ncbi:hypothetical protein COU61_00245 [Candidatus Pacearchaeota archaeon CG10_big_fil_rev_8_21_14_0_10_35_13]|nr:MAG: hypothetical protein COU61_00245 [Candidatus Pacearchaeota archaeon CG10_big_fil_rev_8_21_14_0_10_35_13]